MSVKGRFFAVKMVYFCFVLYFSVISLCFSSFKEKGWGARPAGMAGAFTAIADDANAPLWNPAGLSQVRMKEATFMYAKPYWGLEGVDLALNYLSFIYPLKGKTSTFGTTWASSIAKEQYREDAILLSYAVEWKPVSVGLNLKYLSHKFTLDERTGGDSVFNSGSSKSAFTVDSGVLVKPIPNLVFGLSAKNLTQPDMGLKGKDKVPMEIRFGTAYRVGDYKIMEDILPAFDITYRDPDFNFHYRSQSFNFHVGGEVWFLDRSVGLRCGRNLNETSVGVSYGKFFLGNSAVKLDYAFVSPDNVEGGFGSHRYSLTVRF